MNSRTQRTALVTGANRGIGLAIARALGQQGQHLIVSARNGAAAEQAGAVLRAEGLTATPLTLDVASRDSIDRAVSQLTADGITIDVLVNNAGVLPDGDLLSLSDADIDASLAVHVTGPLHLVRRLAPGMAERRYGRIVNLRSGWGSFAEGLGGPGAYGVSKAALNALTVRLAHDLPASIKVNAMCPGWVRTRMGGASAPVAPEQAAQTAVWLATLPDSGPTGGFFRDRQPIAW